MANETVSATPSVSTPQTPQTGCGCGGHAPDAAHKHDDEECPCAKRRRRNRMIIGAVILVVLGIAAYSAYRMGYFDKGIALLKSKF